MFFTETKIVIYLNLAKLVVGDYRHSKPVFFELPYKDELLTAFDKITTQFPSSSYQIILSKDISYTIRLDQIDQNLDRTQIKTQLAKHIPEDFEDAQFDWKRIDQTTIETFVISQPIYHMLQAVRLKYPSLTLQTCTATSLLLEMGKSDSDSEVSPELFEFVAQKGRGVGKDEAVLSVAIKANSPAGLETPQGHQPKNRWILVAVIIVTILSISGWWIWKSQPSPTIMSPVASSTPSPLPTAIATKNPSDYRITLLNGTSKAGYASDTKTKLEALGFTQVGTGNSPEKSLTTTITIPEALPDEIQQQLIQSLQPLEPIITIEEINTTLSSNDIVIVLGAK